MTGFSASSRRRLCSRTNSRSRLGEACLRLLLGNPGVDFPETENPLLGEGALAEKATRVGRGRVALIGFRAQQRAQTHGTFKLLSKALGR